ncbi:MAG: helix-turn-helix transcriptional regulator [Oscillospiraceae bacterium]|nr:helix-turn-helix transcriptional regulator [Oscillospiraceae bacterium]
MKSVCPVETTLDLIGGKYKALILWHLSAGTLRFNQLQKSVTATPRMLTLQLRELETDGLVERKVYAEVPPKVEYSMTDLGRSLMPILTAMRDWGAEYLRSKDIEPNCFMMSGDAPAGSSF